jgi:8-oxo-(d)GTP phosphatase
VSVSAATIEAAGGLLWRSGANGIEVALVHRPKYDDWSLPKGKLETGEHPLRAALREVEEEAGARVVAGRPLGQARYTVDGRPKRVKYWSLRWAGGEFQSNAEVDAIDWVAIETAADRLKPDRDGFIVEEFLRDPRETRACVVVRHGRAGSRSAWKGRDDERPLDALGRRQALGIVDLLAAYDVSRAHSAGVRRCVDTLAPYAASAQLSIEREPLFSESGFPADPERAVARALEIVHGPGAVAICTQGGALPDLVVDLCRQLGGAPPKLKPVRKGSLVVVHVTPGDNPQFVAIDQLPPPS